MLTTPQALEDKRLELDNRITHLADQVEQLEDVQAELDYVLERHRASADESRWADWLAERDQQRQRKVLIARYGTATPESIADWWQR